jgi:transmembrane sensor
MERDREHLILAYLKGELLPEEQAEFQAWLKLSEDNQRLVSDYRKIWQITVPSNSSKFFQSDLEWRKFEEAMQNDPALTGKKVLLRPYWHKIAAAVVLIAASLSVIYLLIGPNQDIVFQTSENTLRLLLPDSSEVWLNAKSRLAYSDSYMRQRIVELEGEAFFNVRKNASGSFIVKTEDATVKVLGTSFNVRSYADDLYTEVIVVTGKVSFGPKNEDENVVLTPGATGTLGRAGHRLAMDTTVEENALAWKNKALTFSNTPMEKVIRVLQVYFKRNIYIENKEILSCRFTGTFDDPTIAEVMETLSVALDLKVTEQEKSYSLNGSGCEP